MSNEIAVIGHVNAMLVKVMEMHDHFEFEPVNNPITLSVREKAFRVKAFREETREFAVATTLADQLDALVDLQVFLLGTVDRMGLTEVFDEAFTRVMAANMQKEVAGLTKKSKRGFKRDLVKPEGWVAPNLTDLVGE